MSASMTGVRLAFCGASGTGKTTLMERMMGIHHLTCCPVGSRHVAASMGFSNPYEVDRAARRVEFQSRLVSEKASWEQAHHSFITDRTVVDTLTYFALHECVNVTKEVLKIAEMGFARYTHVVLFPVDSFHCLADDPVRIENPTYHRFWEELCFGLVRRFRGRSPRQCTLIELSSERTVSQRLASITSQIERTRHGH